MAQAAFDRLVAWSDVLQDAFSSKHNYIPHMAWEQKLQDQLDLSKDMLRFMLALFAMVPVGAGIRLLKNPSLRHLYSLITGIALTYYPFGSGIIHAIPVTLITYLAMMVAPRRCGTIAWCTVGPYLIYLHVVNASGHNWNQGILDFTGCEMVLALKLISVAMCYQDHHTKAPERMSQFQAAAALHALPSPLEFISYTLSLGNLLSGPYFEFSDYKQFIEHKGVWDPSAAASHPSSGMLLHSLSCLLKTFFFMAVHLGCRPNYNPDTLSSAAYKAAPVLNKLWIILFSGTVFQWKYAFAWSLSETSTTLAGLNFIGWDARSGVPQWGRCTNVRWFTMMASDSARLVPLHWNVGTGQFLRRYVYERATPYGKKPGFAQLLLTQVVSAIWHGLYSGYLVFFVGSAVWIHFSTIIWKAENKLIPGWSDFLPWKLAKILWTHFVLNYMATAFMILNYEKSMALYRSVYFTPHIIMLVGILVGPSVGGGKKSKGASKVESKVE